ncbi:MULTISPECIES: helix-turn-helix domain-containing protein [Dehalobacter]|uniref:Helix-turn-helix domain-containing protein n=2 Tax=Dehalobacter restrictus TaxID=55583 RepID=A0A857DHU4_9FIRM|nr:MULTISPECIES: helix-turn-helix domain-containing protein [Dehalobacter]AHF09259.1 transcriptional regulator [Dehalobacter restrictus DSM 9455]MCG1024581.1 helix-turn-helix domain-containing protein [Dehalobacter sp.]MDJ0306505.1 helix-turn-helix domain-containing protein [Dehalobacter sp.]OCZ50887.1 transcriptional regulator [Dehalobacter sp. TeCB1]QGZ99795.1 helix-turn-helix domain-containing protein [Dehalobacter restrictus]
MENWEKIKAVQRMQEYIDEHLTEPITLHSLARAAGYSPWHSARMFKELIGKAPFEYIRALRLSQAAVTLKDRDRKIIDVAFDFVFDSHEGFTRAFSKEFGITPKTYSQNKETASLKLFIPGYVRDYYLTKQKGESNMSDHSQSNTVFVQVVERSARKLIFKSGLKATHYFEYCEEVGCAVWEQLSAIKEAIYEPIGMWLPDNLRRPDTSLYAQGVEVPADYTGEIPDGYESMNLSPCKMMVFQGQPFDDPKFGEAIEELWEVMKSYNPEIYGFQWADEDGPRFQLAPMGYRGYIEARPVRELKK